jgi:Fe-Mn family superoxide dismutase
MAGRKAGRGHEAAIWRDPERVDEWMGELSKSAPVVAFCVYGFHVGCKTVATLRKAGFDARHMAGGFRLEGDQGPVKLFESTTSS